METTIDRAGRLVIPKPVREQAGLKPGSRLLIEYRDGRVEIEPVRVPVKLVRKGSVTVAVAPPGVPKLTAKAVNRLIDEVRGQRARKFAPKP